MRRSAYRPVVMAGAVTVSAALGGCSLNHGGDDMVKGKQLFVSHCGACHTLSRAGTHGVTGPNLDQAFEQARRDGFGQSTFEGVVHRQIEQPARVPQMDPQTGKPLPLMPANLVKGQDARDVAAYVASAVAKSGKDTGALASVGEKKAAGTAKESGGKLDIPTVPGGGLAYVYKAAQAKAGKVTIESKNPQPVDHDIAIQGNGVNAKGPVVNNGGVSRLQVNLKPGTYTFYCSVPGHRQAGMVGKLTVK